MAEREQRCWLTDDLCVIDQKQFFIYGSLEVPIEGHADPFIWGVCVSLNERDFLRAEELMGVEGRESEPAYLGWLSSDIPLAGCRSAPFAIDENWSEYLCRLVATRYEHCPGNILKRRNATRIPDEQQE